MIPPASISERLPSDALQSLLPLEDELSNWSFNLSICHHYFKLSAQINRSSVSVGGFEWVLHVFSDFRHAGRGYCHFDIDLLHWHFNFASNTWGCMQYSDCVHVCACSCKCFILLQLNSALFTLVIELCFYFKLFLTTFPGFTILLQRSPLNPFSIMALVLYLCGLKAALQNKYVVFRTYQSTSYSIVCLYLVSYYSWSSIKNLIV